MWRAWSENCAKNPENLRGQDFAKSEDMRGQTRSFGAQTVSSHVFNAKSCPLRFSRNLRKALRPGTPHPRTSQAEVKALPERSELVLPSFVFCKIRVP